jgi:inosose dehydratase/3D-(3,5/4)-trihydroxycyclohexane-1,2-dione acylhydrolase (decyclizing)
MAVRIGTNPIGWSNDDLRSLGGDTPLETCLDEAARAGFTGIELGHKFPREPQALKDVLQRHGLDLVSGWYSMALLQRDADAEWAAIEDHKRLLKALGAQVLIVAETSNAIHGDRGIPLSRRPRLGEQEWPVFTRRLAKLAQWLRDEGMQPRLSSPRGHRDRDRRRGAPPDGNDAGAGPPAARHRAPDVRRRRSG